MSCSVSQAVPPAQQAVPGQQSPPHDGPLQALPLQEPLVQVWPAEHCLPQAPQFAGSVCVFTQAWAVPQAVWPEGQAQAEATSKLKQMQFDLVKDFREQVRPIAKRIANNRGMTVVLIHNEAFVLDHDPSTDITDAVISDMPRASATGTTPATETPAAE